MTALNAAILFNNSTGSDTTASGSSAGPNVYGSGASTTSGSAVVTGITTTGVQAGDLLWVQSSSGRQFSVIASVDSGTQVTCDDTFANTESSRTWAIGGKRATLDNADSRLIVTTDNPTGQWTVELENTGTDYAITSTLSLRSVTIQGNDENNPTGVTFNQNAVLFNAVTGGSWIKNLHLKCTASSKTSATAINKGASNTGFEVSNLIFDATDNWNKAFSKTASAAGGLRVRKCKINNTITNISDWDVLQEFYDCVFSNCSGNGIRSSSNTCIVKNCVFNGCSGSLIYQSGNPTNVWVIQGNVFNGGAVALNFYTYTYQMAYVGAFENIFVGFTAVAINNKSTDTGFQISRNAFYNNTADYNGTHDGNITLTADPFVDAANGDFNLNADAGGGATLRANNFSLNTDTAVYPFRQYVSDAFGAGGGGAVLHPLRSN